MSTYAQITGGVVLNTLDLDDATLIPEFSAGFDAFIQIDGLTPIPAVNWAWDGTTFYPGLQVALIQGGVVSSVVLGSALTIASPPAGYTAVDVTLLQNPTIQAGFLYNGSTFTPSSAFYTQLLADSTAFGYQTIQAYLLLTMNLGILPSGVSPALLDYCSTLFAYLNAGMLNAAVAQITVMIADSSPAKTALTPYLTNAILVAMETSIVTWMSTYQ